MINYKFGTYGFLNYDLIAEQSLRIIDFGIEKRQNENYCYDNKERNYEGYLFQYTLDGWGVLEREGEKYKLMKDKAFFLTFPDESKYYLPKEEAANDHWTYFFIHFAGPAVTPFFNRIKELKCTLLTLDLDSPPIRMFFELFDLVENQKQLERYKGSQWLYNFLIALLKSVEFPSSTKKSYYVSASISWMQANYSSSQNIEDMCREIGVSFSHLTRQFYKEQGLTPIQYLSHLRTEHAMYLLLNTELTIEHIAKKCGFSCGNYFSKVFKKSVYMTPMEYRKMHKRG